MTVAVAVNRQVIQNIDKKHPAAHRVNQSFVILYDFFKKGVAAGRPGSRVRPVGMDRPLPRGRGDANEAVEKSFF
jgi:hypothetical protein